MYKKFKRYGKRAYRKVVRPYVNKKKGFRNRMKLYKEITAIKRMINAEKKTAESFYNGVGVGQLNNGSDGAYCATLTPVISQGVGFANRTGRSIKCSGMYLRGQFNAQTNTINAIKFNLTIVKVVGATQTTTEILNGMYNADALSGIRDYFAPRNPDNFRDFRVIASRNFNLYPDQITGQQSKINFAMPLKLRHHIRYENNTNTIQEGELYYIIRATDGDGGSPNTGAFFDMSIRLTYYDN